MPASGAEARPFHWASILAKLMLGCSSDSLLVSARSCHQVRTCPRLSNRHVHKRTFRPSVHTSRSALGRIVAGAIASLACRDTTIWYHRARDGDDARGRRNLIHTRLPVACCGSYHVAIDGGRQGSVSAPMQKLMHTSGSQLFRLPGSLTSWGEWTFPFIPEWST